MPPPSPAHAPRPRAGRRGGPCGSRGPRRTRRAARRHAGVMRTTRPQKAQRAAAVSPSTAPRGADVGRRDHPGASAASLRPRPAQGNPDASSFRGPRRGRGIPVGGVCGWCARAASPGSARWPAAAARAARRGHRTGNSDGRGHRRGRSAPPLRTARTRRVAPRSPPPGGPPEGFTPPAARAMLYPVSRSVSSRHRGR